ncbi:MAG: bacteriocin [Chloroflexi bacterium]|nr:bacteriocin [Chloroflexota bacterium]
MANKYLGREDAPLSAALWEKLDTAMIEAAKHQLTGRRLLHIEGPYGLGLKAIPMDDLDVGMGWEEIEVEPVEGKEDELPSEEDLLEEAYPTEVLVSGIIPVALLRTSFTLGVRDLANYDREGVGLDLSTVAQAASACARAEDDLIFHGSEILGTDGLLDVPGHLTVKLSTWKKAGEAVEDMIAAVTELDHAGFHGPYALALAPARYNLLYRRYGASHHTELDQMESMITEGIFKAPVLKDGGVLLASGRQFASIVLGQDMTIGFIGPSGGDIEFYISESLALRVRQPRSICVLEG